MNNNNISTNLWKHFIYNDGCMTNNLINLHGKIDMNLVSSKEFSLNYKQNQKTDCNILQNYIINIINIFIY